ncbi:MAG: acyl-CoA dehydrogenase family protein [Desulfobacterales bacterium]
MLGGMAGHALIPAILRAAMGFLFSGEFERRGIETSKPVYSLGLHACPAVDVSFKTRNYVGKAGEGNCIFDKMTARLSVASTAMALGMMKGSFKEALGYAQKRSQRGREIFNWSEVRMMLANMAIDMKNAELTVSRAAGLDEAGWDNVSIAAAVKIQEMACNLTTDSIQVMGGAGYMKDFGQEKRFRDAKAYRRCSA